MNNLKEYILEKFKISKDIKNNVISLSDKISDLFSGLEVFDNKKDDIMKEINSFINEVEYNKYFLYTADECEFANGFKDYFTNKMPYAEFSKLVSKSDIYKDDTLLQKFEGKNTHLEIMINKKSNAIYIVGLYPTKYFREILIILEK